MNKILKCEHSNESYWAVFSCCTIYYGSEGGSNIDSVNELLKCRHSVLLLLCCTRLVRTFESVREILKCVQLNIKVTEQYFPLVFKHVQYSPLADVVKVVIQLVWVVRVVKQWLKLVLGTTYNWLWWWLPLPVVETSVNVITKCLSRVILYGMKLLRVSIFSTFCSSSKD